MNDFTFLSPTRLIVGRNAEDQTGAWINMDFYKRALALRKETAAHRRWLHLHAEAGLDIPNEQAYVMERLRNCGLEPQPCGHDAHRRGAL